MGSFSIWFFLPIICTFHNLFLFANLVVLVMKTLSVLCTVVFFVSLAWAQCPFLCDCLAKSGSMVAVCSGKANLMNTEGIMVEFSSCPMELGKNLVKVRVFDKMQTNLIFFKGFSP